VFLRCHRRKKDGKIHRYWSIVESRRTSRGPVQRHVLYLGEINDSQLASWEKAITVFDEQYAAERPLALYPADRPMPEHAREYGVSIRLDVKGSVLDIVYSPPSFLRRYKRWFG